MYLIQGLRGLMHILILMTLARKKFWREENLEETKFSGIGGNLIWRMHRNVNFGRNLIWRMSENIYFCEN